MVYEIFFSPTGGTSKALRKLSAAWSGMKKTVDMFRSDYMKRLPELNEEDVCIIAAPVYAGRIPSIAAERFSLLKGNGAKAVIIAVYGNRAVEDALVEMEDIFTAGGFKIIAGAEAVAEHSLVREYGAGRPDREDARCLLEFGRKIMAKLDSGSTDKPHFPGNRPYRELKTGGIQPQVQGGCINCGICARECPAGAIKTGGLWTADPDKCISCMHCIRFCPKSYRTVPEEKLSALRERLRPVCSHRRENRLYL